MSKIPVRVGYIDLLVLPGPAFEGELRIDGAATRPLMPMGPIHDMSARLRFIED